MDLKEKIVDACQRGVEDIFEETVVAGVDVNSPDSEGCYPLHWAAINDRLPIIKRLLELGADPNVVGGILQSTPLHWSARVGHIGASRLLIHAGAVCNIRDTQGNTPLHLAIQGNHMPLVAYLLAKFEMAKNFTDASGMTPVMIAAFRCYQLFPIRLLINQKVVLNAQEYLQGNTALHIAVQDRNYCAVSELIRGGADVSIKNKQHETPLDLAVNNRNLKLQKMLHKAARNQGIEPKSCIQSFTDDDAFKKRKEFALPFIYFITVALFFHYIHYGLAAFFSIVMIFLMKLALGSEHSMHHSMLPLAITIVEPTIMTFTWISYVHNSIPWYAQIAYPVTIVILFGSLIYIMSMDPGVIPPSSSPMEHFVKLVEEQEVSNFCFSCFIERPKDSKHCSTCDKCVRNFDHHCPWLNQCVTAGNQKTFLVFVLSVAMSSAVFLLASMILITTEMRTYSFGIILSRYSWLFVTGMLAGAHIFLMTTLFCSQIIQISEHDTTNAKIKRMRAHGHSHNNRNVSCADRITNLIEFCGPQSVIDVQPQRIDVFEV